jgi:hypothetical protein
MKQVFDPKEMLYQLYPTVIVLRFQPYYLPNKQSAISITVNIVQTFYNSCYHFL